MKGQVMRLSSEDFRHLHTGAIFNACTVDPDWSSEELARILSYMRSEATQPELRSVEEFDDDAVIVSVGYVNNGLPPSDLRPVGDEFAKGLKLVQEALGRPIAGLMPLAVGNLNALAPFLVGMQTGLPVVDADPMGRIFPKVNQTVFTLAGLPVGPVAAAGPAGESALVHVEQPARAERLLRALAGEFGGWAATVTYPMTANTLSQAGVLGSISRMLRVGQILNSSISTQSKHEALRRSVGVQQIIRARVSDVTWIGRPTLPGQTDTPWSVVLVEEPQGRIVQLEIQNELLMVMIDGAVRAVVPDLITMLRPEDGSVANLEDLWVGNTIDIVVMPGAERWYTPEGLRLAGPTAFNVLGQGRREQRK